MLRGQMRTWGERGGEGEMETDREGEGRREGGREGQEAGKKRTCHENPVWQLLSVQLMWFMSLLLP